MPALHQSCIWPAPHQNGAGPAKIKLKFSKLKSVAYISHLDLMRLFSRALRRAEIPVALSQGFSPHPKISIFPALKLGKESVDLEANIYLNEPIDEQEFKIKLQAQLPDGIKILDVSLVSPKSETLNSKQTQNTNFKTLRLLF